MAFKPKRYFVKTGSNGISLLLATNALPVSINSDNPAIMLINFSEDRQCLLRFANALNEGRFVHKSEIPRP